jgi:hypothetical protein
VQHPDGYRKYRQAVEEVGGAVQRVQHPQEVRGRRVCWRRAGVGFRQLFLSQHGVAGKPAGNLRHQVLLAGPVGGGHRVPLVVVLELDGHLAAEVARQHRPGAAGQLRGGGLQLLGYLLVNGGQRRFSNNLM